MIFVYLGIAVWVFVIGWSLSRAARLGDEQQSLSHAECVTRTQPHGNCEVIPFPDIPRHRGGRGPWSMHLHDDRDNPNGDAA